MKPQTAHTVWGSCLERIVTVTNVDNAQYTPPALQTKTFAEVLPHVLATLGCAGDAAGNCVKPARFGMCPSRPEADHQ